MTAQNDRPATEQAAVDELVERLCRLTEAGGGLEAVLSETIPLIRTGQSARIHAAARPCRDHPDDRYRTVGSLLRHAIDTGLFGRP